jgi:hypothetical protein
MDLRLPEREREDAGEDLAGLAVKVRRILEDEARRHGIDV